MKMIPTREELVEEIMHLINCHIDAYGHIEDEVYNCAEDIVDLFQRINEHIK